MCAWGWGKRFSSPVQRLEGREAFKTGRQKSLSILVLISAPVITAHDAGSPLMPRCGASGVFVWFCFHYKVLPDRLQTCHPAVPATYVLGLETHASVSSYFSCVRRRLKIQEFYSKLLELQAFQISTFYRFWNTYFHQARISNLKISSSPKSLNISGILSTFKDFEILEHSKYYLSD